MFLLSSRVGRSGQGLVGYSQRFLCVFHQGWVTSNLSMEQFSKLALVGSQIWRSCLSSKQKAGADWRGWGKGDLEGPLVGLELSSQI